MSAKEIAMKSLCSLVLALASVSLASCGFFAEQTAAPKRPGKARNEPALKADAVFWNTLHSGDYDGIGAALDASTAAYLNDPFDAVTAAHVGWLHIWKLAESARLEGHSPSITDHAVLARRYFQEAVSLDPSDARYLGFLASAQLTEGAIHKDEKLTRRGYYTLLASIDAWPEFNLFTAGYTMGGQPVDSPRFKQGLDWLWRNIDECLGAKIDRRNPDVSAYLGLTTKEGRKRVCWNSWIAPHNFEGFFLSMGDILVKDGDWQTARRVYANARLAPDYASWTFAPLLQTRIEDAEANVGVFAGTTAPKAGPGPTMMSRSGFACVACHQQ
jgi:hypothetical protein